MLSVEFMKWGDQGAHAWLCVDGRRMVELGSGSHFESVRDSVCDVLRELATQTYNQESPHA